MQLQYGLQIELWGQEPGERGSELVVTFCRAKSMGICGTSWVTGHLEAQQEPITPDCHRLRL